MKRARDAGARQATSPTAIDNAPAAENITPSTGGELYYINSTGDLVAVEVNAESAFAIGKSTTLFRTAVPAARRRRALLAQTLTPKFKTFGLQT